MALSPHYQRDWQRKRAKEDPEWYERRKQDRTRRNREHKQYWVKQFGGKCLDCKKSYPPAVYDFHHVDEETKKVPKRSTNYVLMLSRESAAKELAKCVLLCANCHRIRHSIDYLTRRYA